MGIHHGLPRQNIRANTISAGSIEIRVALAFSTSRREIIQIRVANNKYL